MRLSPVFICSLSDEAEFYHYQVTEIGWWEQLVNKKESKTDLYQLQIIFHFLAWDLNYISK